VQQQFMPSFAGLGGQRRHVVGIGHEGQGNDRRKPDRQHRIRLCDADVIQHHGNGRSVGGRLARHRVSLPLG
jgi:hypothetical protein